MKRKIFIGISVLFLALVVVLISLQGGKEVEAVKAKKGTLTRTIEETGYVQAKDSFDIQALQNGRIVELFVNNGEMVKKGQKLMTLENLDLNQEAKSVQAQIDAARAEFEAGKIALDSSRVELEKAEKNLQRKVELLKAGAISQVDYDNAVLNVSNLQSTVAHQEAYIKSVQANLNSLQKINTDINTKRQQLIIKSPVDGKILDLPVEIEDLIFAGSILTQVGTEGKLEIKADILSDDMGEIKEGQKVNITAPVLGKNNLNGIITEIYPRAYEKTSALGIVQRRVPLIVSLDNSDKLKPGYEVRVIIETAKKENTLLLPREAVCSTEDMSEVMLIVDKKIEHRKIKSGLKNQEYIEVNDGLREGDLVVRDASLNIENKTKVRVSRIIEIINNNQSF